MIGLFGLLSLSDYKAAQRKCNNQLKCIQSSYKVCGDESASTKLI